MQATEYLEQRLDDQIDWYDRKSQWNQRWFKRLRGAEILLASGLPLLVLLQDYWPRGIAALIGAAGFLIAVISGLTVLHKFEENWQQYRTTCESLRHQKFLYLTGTAPYHGEDAFAQLVTRAEAAISQENSNWLAYVGASENKS